MKANNTPANVTTILAAAAALLGIVAVAVLLNYFIKAIGCLMIYISETCNVPL